MELTSKQTDALALGKW